MFIFEFFSSTVSFYIGFGFGIYSIKRFHDVSLKCNPCEDKLVKMCYEGSKRILSKPINKKQPITVEMLHKIVDHFGSNYLDLSGLRICTICILGFSGFFR